MAPRCNKLAPADPTPYWTPFVHLPKRLTCADGALFVTDIVIKEKEKLEAKCSHC